MDAKGGIQWEIRLRRNNVSAFPEGPTLLCSAVFGVTDVGAEEIAFRVDITH